MSTKFNFKKLDARTRSIMIDEIKLAIATNNLYISTRFNEIGIRGWNDWLLAAAEKHDEHWLAYQLEHAGAMKHLEGRSTPSGGYTIAHVPDTAAETMAEGQFNRFYMAAICQRAIQENKSSVSIYRAKSRGEPRAESKAMEGSSRQASILLEDLRVKDKSLKSDLLKVNSGLSIDC